MEIAVYELGGNAVTLDVGKGTWSLEHLESVVMDSDKTEHIKEAARVLSRYVAAIGVRAFPEMKNYDDEMTDPVVRGFAEHSDVPVFNLESSRHHPFQALADAMTIREKLGGFSHQRVVLSWAYHPKPLPMAVPNSFALIAALIVGTGRFRRRACRARLLAGVLPPFALAAGTYLLWNRYRFGLWLPVSGLIKTHWLASLDLHQHLVGLVAPASLRLEAPIRELWKHQSFKI